MSLLGLSLSLITCTSNDNEQQKKQISETLAFTPIAQHEIVYHTLTGAGQEGIEQATKVIGSARDWRALIQAIAYMPEGNAAVVAILENATIDFEHEDVLAVFEAIKTTNGYHIEIIKVEEYEKELRVTIQRLQKGGDATVMTQPFHIVKIPKRSKPILFFELD